MSILIAEDNVAQRRYLRELLERELLENAARMGAYMMDRLRDWPRRFAPVGDVRGLGLMIGVELVRDRKTKEKAPELRDRVLYQAFERGLLVLGSGDNTIRLCPPLVITKEQADIGLDILEQCIAMVGQSAKAEQPGKGKPQGA